MSKDAREAAIEPAVTISEKMRSITPEEFGLRVAAVFNETKSSGTIFYIQQALKDCEDDNGIYWDLFQEMLDRFERYDAGRSSAAQQDDWAERAEHCSVCNKHELKCDCVRFAPAPMEEKDGQ